MAKRKTREKEGAEQGALKGKTEGVRAVSRQGSAATVKAWAAGSRKTRAGTGSTGSAWLRQSCQKEFL